MSPFENAVDAMRGLSNDEKLKLRLLLDSELSASTSPVSNGTKSGKGILGLFADEPDLMDSVVEAAYERRARPLRLNT